MEEAAAYGTRVVERQVCVVCKAQEEMDEEVCGGCGSELDGSAVVRVAREPWADGAGEKWESE